LVGVLLAVGCALVVVSVATGSYPVTVFGLVFVAGGIYNARLILYRTACELALDDRQGLVRWRSTLGGGEVAVSTIQSIQRVPKRPSVYVLRCNDGTKVAFWLVTTDRAVESFFEALRNENPNVKQKTFISVADSGGTVCPPGSALRHFSPTPSDKLKRTKGSVMEWSQRVWSVPHLRDASWALGN
jgi:hypothetical protein